MSKSVNLLYLCASFANSFYVFFFRRTHYLFYGRQATGELFGSGLHHRRLGVHLFGYARQNG
jgi:hypothetical protein